MSKLDEIEARLSAATPGPWHADHEDERVFNDTCVVQGNYGWVPVGPEGRYPAYDEDTEQGRADAEFIGHSRADLAALVAVVREVEAVADFAAVSGAHRITIERRLRTALQKLEATP